MVNLKRKKESDLIIIGVGLIIVGIALLGMVIEGLLNNFKGFFIGSSPMSVYNAEIMTALLFIFWVISFAVYTKEVLKYEEETKYEYNN